MDLSIVIPVHNEAENILPLVREISDALDGRFDYEIVYVDDGSSDDTPARLLEVAMLFPQVRVLRHERQAGQSAALSTGVRNARAPIVATLDGDGQNDPSDIRALLERLNDPAQGRLAMAAGHRVVRKDSRVQRFSSRAANAVRSRMLRDGTPDTGCGLKVFRRDIFLELPNFDHMHRFLPALVMRQGGRVVSVPVGHRPRRRGRSHYGVHNRLWVGLVDLFGVMWLNRRSVVVDAIEISAQPMAKETQ